MGALTFAQSGGAVHPTLDDVAELALEYGYEKKPPRPSQSKPSQRADMAGFFTEYGVKAFSPWREMFVRAPMLPPDEHRAAVEKAEKEVEEVVIPDVTDEEYEEAAKEFDAVEKKWKLFKKPGGAAVKSDLYYSSTGAKSQVEKGDCTEEEPQWDEKGAIDYAGKLVWGGYKQHQGKTTAEAKAIFVKLLRDAQADKKNNFF